VQGEWGKRREQVTGCREQDDEFGGGKARWVGSGLLVYVALSAGAAADSTGALRRRMVAETRVMRRPTGRGSMKV